MSGEMGHITMSNNVSKYTASSNNILARILYQGELFHHGARASEMGFWRHFRVINLSVELKPHRNQLILTAFNKDKG